MDTKSYEVLIHSQYAFESCRKEVYDFEDCRQTSSPVAKNPELCRPYSKALLGCYKEAERMDPICLGSFNDARECLFKGDGNMYNCKTFLNEYAHCQKNPVDFKSFLESSTKIQKKQKKFDFLNWRGYYDRHMG